MESAAAIAGLIKVLLMIQNKCIVPSLHYSKENENPKLNLEDYGFIIPTSCIEWETRTGQPRTASLNSFSFGGTNAHAIVSEYVETENTENEGPNGIFPIINLSAADNATLFEKAKFFKETIESSEQDIVQLSLSIWRQNMHLKKRKAFASESREELVKLCTSFITERTKSKTPHDVTNIVFVFCGVGTVWRGMCLWLLKNKVFSKTLDDIDKYLFRLTGWNIKEKLLSEDPQIQTDPMTAHISIFACQVGLFKVWQYLGIKPNKVIGQSVGEVAAAFASGAIDLKTAVYIVFHRSKLLSNINFGKMAVVLQKDVEEVKQFCENENDMYISVLISPSSCTVSGSIASIEKLKEKLSSNGGKIVPLDVSCAYHSPFVEQASTELAQTLGNLSKGEYHTPMISTVTGKAVSAEDIADSKYWEKNVLSPVLFGEAIKASRQPIGQTLFVEIGPSPVLEAHMNDIFRPEIESVSVIPSVRRHDESHSFIKAICDIYESGLDLQWERVLPTKPIKRKQTQKTKFNNVHVFLDTENGIAVRKGLENNKTRHPYIKIVGQTKGCSEFEAGIDFKNTPFVYSNIKHDQNVIPQSLYVDIGLHVGTIMYGVHIEQLVLSLDFLRPVSVDPAGKTFLSVETSVGSSKTVFDVSHKNALTCRGWMAKSEVTKINTAKRYNIEGIRTSIKINPHKTLIQEDFREVFGSIGIACELAHRLTKQCIYNSSMALLDVKIPEDSQDFCFKSFYPSMFDCMLHATVVSTLEHQNQQGIRETDGGTVFPISASGIRWFRQFEVQMHIFSIRTNRTLLETGEKLHYNVQLIDCLGNKIAEVENVTVCTYNTNYKLPTQIRYLQSWEPVLDLIAAEENIRNLVIAKGFSVSECKELNWDTSVNCLSCTLTDSDAESLIEDSLKSKRITPLEQLDAITFIVKGKFDLPEFTDTHSHTIYKGTAATAMFVIDLIRYLAKKRLQTPLYIVTEATQQIPDESNTALNFIGSELWGLIRAAQVDFVHSAMTSIDLRPSLRDTKEQLLEFVNATCKDMEDTATDYAIDKRNIYKLQLQKSPQFHKIPLTRTALTTLLPYRTNQMFVSSSEDVRQEDLFLTPEDRQSVCNERNVISLKVATITVPPLFIQASTVQSRELKQVNLMQMDSKPLFAVEFTGFQMDKSDNYQNGTCLPSQTECVFDTCSKQEYVVLYPAIVCTEMTVPKSVTVRKKDLPFYEPGLLLYCALFWKYLEFVPTNAKVVIFCKNKDDKRCKVLKSLLISLRQATVFDLSMMPCDNKTDVCIAIDDITCGLSLLSKDVRIICTKTQQGTEVQNVLKLAGNEIVKIKAEDVYTFSYLSNTVYNIVNWLKNNQQIYSTLNQPLVSKPGHSEETFPCRCLSISSEESVQFPIKLTQRQLFNKFSTYLVSGGLTGLGWETTKVLAEMGAGAVATLSRSTVTAEALDKIRNLESKTHCKIIPLRADVSSIAQLRQAFKELYSRSTHPVKGIFHLAGALDTNPLMTITKEQLENVLLPKVLGTMNLHVLCNEMNIRLDYFVVSSSINAVLGSPGQSNYGAANSFMDSFISWRRTSGLVGQTINWGALNLGFALSSNFIRNFEKLGYKTLAIPEIRACLVAELMENSSGIVYANVDWEIASQIFTVQKLRRIGKLYKSLFKQVLSSCKPVQTTDMKFDVNCLKRCNAKEQKEALMRAFSMIASIALNTEIGKIRTDQSLVEMGFDSLSAVSAINLVQEMTGYRIPVELLWNPSTTLQNIIDNVQENIFGK